jgi:hypothetical protein
MLVELLQSGKQFVALAVTDATPAEMNRRNWGARKTDSD